VFKDSLKKPHSCKINRDHLAGKLWPTVYLVQHPKFSIDKNLYNYTKVIGTRDEEPDPRHTGMIVDATALSMAAGIGSMFKRSF